MHINLSSDELWAFDYPLILPAGAISWWVATTAKMALIPNGTLYMETVPYPVINTAANCSTKYIIQLRIYTLSQMLQYLMSFWMIGITFVLITVFEHLFFYHLFHQRVDLLSVWPLALDLWQLPSKKPIWIEEVSIYLVCCLKLPRSSTSSAEVSLRSVTMGELNRNINQSINLNK